MANGYTLGTEEPGRGGCAAATIRIIYAGQLVDFWQQPVRVAGGARVRNSVAGMVGQPVGGRDRVCAGVRAVATA
eukprot:6059650-Prymnesium_polylepis.1